MATAIKISAQQIAAAQKEIREWFPGKGNAGIRSVLRRQLEDQVFQIDGQEFDALFPALVKLGRGILFIDGAGDQRTQNFNADVNKALGLT